MTKKAFEAAYQEATHLARKRKSSQRTASVLRLLRYAAGGGHPDAEYALGTWYLFGIGVRKNARKAAEHFERAAHAGNASAQFDLAVCYEVGRGRRKSLRNALRWYRSAAKKGDADAQHEMGRLVGYGLLGRANRVKGFRWYLLSARKGHLEAMAAVAWCYEQGRGTRVNLRLARLWDKKLAGLRQKHGRRGRLRNP